METVINAFTTGDVTLRVSLTSKPSRLDRSVAIPVALCVSLRDNETRERDRSIASRDSVPFTVFGVSVPTPILTNKIVTEEYRSRSNDRTVRVTVATTSKVVSVFVSIETTRILRAILIASTVFHLRTTVRTIARVNTIVSIPPASLLRKLLRRYLPLISFRLPIAP